MKLSLNTDRYIGAETFPGFPTSRRFRIGERAPASVIDEIGILKLHQRVTVCRELTIEIEAVKRNQAETDWLRKPGNCWGKS